MRWSGPAAVAAGLAFAAGGGCLEPASSLSDAGIPCSPPCSGSETCDPSSGNCVPALLEGELCPGADGGLCQPPLVCGPVTSQEQRCSVDCTMKTAGTVCASTQACYARPQGGGGFCLTPATDAGDACDTSLLTLCVGTNLVCVSKTASSTAGECFQVCDPAIDACGGGQTCADPWAPSDPTDGICVTPDPDGGCDYAQFEFCPRGDTCAIGPSSSSGHCHLRCTPGTVGACASTEECIAPWPSAPDQGICVTPQPTGGKCDVSADLWCGTGDICVFIQGEGTACAVDCTDNPGACSGSGKTCQPLGDGRSACV